MALAASPTPMFLHCLPADRGYEVTCGGHRRPRSRHLGRGGEPPACPEGAARVAPRTEATRDGAGGEQKKKQGGANGQGSSAASGAADGEHGTNEGALWGARFAARPVTRARARSRSSTHFDWQLAAYDLAGLAGARARARGGRATSTTAELARDARRARRARAARLVGRASSPPPTDEDVHGALEARARSAIVGPELGGKLRAGRSRNDQIATLVRLYLNDHARRIGHAASCTSSTRSPPRRTRTGTAIMPGRTHLQHAQPVLLAHHLLAHALGASCATSSGCATGRAGRMSRPTARGALAGSTLGLDPAARRRATSASRRAPRTRSTAPRAATSWPSSRTSPR